MHAVYRIIEHTADVAIEAEAGDLEALFDRCAAGMFSLIADRAPERPAKEQLVELEAFDPPELLVAWLRELLWLHVDRGFFYTAAAFEVLATRSLRARVLGSVVGDTEREIKAVTYHDLVVERRHGGWYARVIFDV